MANKEKKCYCSGYASQREAAPRIWECPRCGKTGFAVTIGIIRTIAEEYDVPYDVAWDWAKALLEWKKVETQAHGDATVYYCENHFNKDLRQEFSLERTWRERIKDYLARIRADIMSTESFRDSRF